MIVSSERKDEWTISLPELPWVSDTCAVMGKRVLNQFFSGHRVGHIARNYAVFEVLDHFWTLLDAKVGHRPRRDRFFQESR